MSAPRGGDRNRRRPADPRRYPNRRHVEVDLGPERLRRRNLNRVTIAVAALLVLIIAVTGIAQRLQEDAPPPSAVQLAEAITVPVAGAIPVRVLRIIDGDTLEVRSASTDLTVRLFGVDTPERGEHCYAEATARLRELAGLHVQLLPDGRLTDRFGRELRYVYTSDGRLVDEALIVEGLGRAWTAEGAFRDALVAAEAEARAAARGCLWQ